jgi:hypothetical protein
MNDYDRTIQAIKDLDCVVSKTKWNKIAAEHNFLTSYTLRCLSNMNFRDFCTKIRKKN